MTKKKTNNPKLAKRKRRLQRRKAIRAAATSAQDFRISIEAGADSEFKLLAADGEGEARKLRKFSMTAYTGGRLLLAGFYYPVVVDLKGAKIPNRSRPILRDHDPGRIVGHTDTITADDRRIKLTGLISAANEHAREVSESADNGFPWEASIGASATRLVFVDRGETVEVNGRKFTGPLYVARTSLLKEVSFVALGADENGADAKVAAGADTFAKEAIPMGFEQWLKAKGFSPDDLSEAQEVSMKAMWQAEQDAAGGQSAGNSASDNRTPLQAVGRTGTTASSADDPGVPGGGTPLNAADEIAVYRQQMAAETRRVSEIRAAVARHHVNVITINDQEVDLCAHAIAEAWTPERTELEAMRSARPQAPAGHVRSSDLNQPVLGSALLLAMGHGGEETVEVYGEQAVEAAGRHFRRGIGLQQFLMIQARAGGWHGDTFRGNEKAILRAAFSTNDDTSGILSNVANKMLLQGWMTVDQSWRRVAAVGRVNDFKAHTRYRLTGSMQYEKVGATGEIKHAEFGEDTFSNQAETYARMLTLTRQDLLNDDLGAFESIKPRLGRGGALAMCDVFWKAFMDNSAFFTTQRKNYFAGASSNLQSSSLKTAVEKFRKQTDPGNKPLGLQPTILLVPPEEEVTAQELYISTNHNTGGAAATDKVPNRNVHAGKYEPVVSPYLSNDSYANYSTTAWYLLADPADAATIEVVFLNGVESPTIEDAAADFNVLGIQFRGFHDFGVALQEYLAGVKSKGAA